MNKATVVAYTKPVYPAYNTNIIELIACCARVSNPANQWNRATSKKLFDYLMENKHFSPLEMADIVIEIETTRDIARQLLRHRSFSFQEFSQRYAEVTKFSEPREARLQDKKNRQNSIEFDNEEVHKWWNETQDKVTKFTNEVYQDALKIGIAKEVARSVLPEGLTMSRLYMKGSFRSWWHYLAVRLDPTTQKEHRDLAEKIHKCVMQVVENRV